MSRLVTRLWWVAVLAAIVVGACVKPPTPDPVSPLSLGGSAGIGGVSGAGGVAGMSAVDAAGSSAVAGAASGGATVAIEWPECAAAAKKVTKVDIDAMRKRLMPKRSHVMHRRVRASYTVLDYGDVFWNQLAPTLDQRNLGSCTGNGGIQVRVSRPFLWLGSLDADVLEALAVDVYSGATRRDQWDGSYPPDDTGSDSGSVMAELRDRNLISGWKTIVTLEGLQSAEQSGPCSFDTDWYTGFFEPDRCGQVQMTGVVEGGHATKAAGIQYSTKRLLLLNSWGNNWGAKVRSSGRGGYYWLKFGDVQKLLQTGAATLYCPTVSPDNDNALVYREAS